MDDNRRATREALVTMTAVGQDAPATVLISGDDAISSFTPGRFDLLGTTDLYRLSSQPMPHRLRVPANYLRLRKDLVIPRATTAINLVTDADRNPKVLRALQTILKRHPGRVINRPEAVMLSTREGVARRAAAIPGLIAPATARLPATPAARRRAAEQIGFPAILREAGTHGGVTARLVADADAIEGVVAGSRAAHLLTAFVDARLPDGLYRKLRVFFIGGVPVIRHLLASDHWNVHAADRARVLADAPDLRAAEEATVAAGFDALPTPARDGLRALAGATALDFVGVDFALAADGRAILFEANATMNFLPMSDDPRFSYLHVAYRRAQVAWDRLVGNPAAEAA